MNNLVPRSITWEILQKTRNEAAVAVLASGLLADNLQVRHTSLNTLLARPESSARKTLLMHWEKFNEDDFVLLQRSARQFETIAKAMLISGPLQEKRIALQAIMRLELTESLAAVLDIVIDSHHALQPHANECLQHICQQWGSRARQGRDVPSVRHPMLETLHRYLQNFPKHRSLQVVEIGRAHG